MEWINEKAKTLKQGAIRAMFDRANTMTGVISLGIGEPDMPTPKLVCEAAKEALDKGITHYTPNAGTLSFRQAIAEKSYLKDLHYDPKTEIIITNGGMGALSLLFLVLLNKGDEILIQDPQWLNYVAQVAYCDGTAVRVPTDLAHNFEMQPETIEKLITPHTKALMINTPNNPTGSVMTRETMAKIAELAVKHDLLVISDDVYNTLLYAGEEAPCIASFPGMKERTVIVNSFSKSYAMTGWRIGFVAAPAEIVDRMTKCQENFNACANAPGQYAATVALDHPELCEELRQVFERRRDVLVHRVKPIFGPPDFNGDPLVIPSLHQTYGSPGIASGFGVIAGITQHHAVRNRHAHLFGSQKKHVARGLRMRRIVPGHNGIKVVTEPRIPHKGFYHRTGLVGNKYGFYARPAQRGHGIQRPGEELCIVIAACDVTCDVKRTGFVDRFIVRRQLLHGKNVFNQFPNAFAHEIRHRFFGHRRRTICRQHVV